MEQEILTFRDWQENFVTIHYNLNLFEIKIVSFGNLIVDEYSREKVKEILNSESKYLLKYYNTNFDLIQKQFQKLIKESI